MSVEFERLPSAWAGRLSWSSRKVEKGGLVGKGFVLPGGGVLRLSLLCPTAGFPIPCSAAP